MGAASPGKRTWVVLQNSISRQRTRLSSQGAIHESRGRADQSLGDRTLSVNLLDNALEVSRRAATVQGVARRASAPFGADRSFHPQEPHAQPGRSAFYRTRTRSRKATGA